MSTPAVSDKNSPYFQALVPSTTWVLDYTNTAADIGPFDEDVTLVEVFTTTDAWVLVKQNGVAGNATPITSGNSGTSFFCPGGIVRFIGLPPTKGIQYELSIVRSTASGTAYITEAL